MTAQCLTVNLKFGEKNTGLLKYPRESILFYFSGPTTVLIFFLKNVYNFRVTLLHNNRLIGNVMRPQQKGSTEQNLYFGSKKKTKASKKMTLKGLHNLSTS